MALGEFKLFQYKSKDQREKEQKEYAAWAFPYGELQKTNLTALLTELRPKESEQILMFSFLTCKEIYKNAAENTESREEIIRKALSSAKRYKQIMKNADLSMYLAVVLADADIDEMCEYPSADEIRVSMQEIDTVGSRK